MTEIHVDEHVQLMKDIPELGLRRGEIGRVCSTWFEPGTAYEVEFQREKPDCSVRALVMLKQITVKGMAVAALLFAVSGCASLSIDDAGESPQAIEAADRQPPQPHRGTDNPGYVDPHARATEQD